MFKRFANLPKFTRSRQFSTLYRFEDSYFNFALNVNANDLIDNDQLPQTKDAITAAYGKGVNKIIVKLKENNDTKDVIKISKHIRELRETLPELEIQGLRYSMMFNQKTKDFLRNEFLFGLKAAKHIAHTLFPQTFFFVESNEFFRSAIDPEQKESFEKALFNYDILEETVKGLEFADLAYVLKYEDGQGNKENLNKFFQIYKAKNLAFDLELNKAFLQKPTEDKKKNTAEFIKYCYGFEPHFKAFNLYDYKFIEEETLEPTPSRGLEEDVSIPVGSKSTKKVQKEKRVPLGEGVIDFKLVFDLMKISHFQGALVFPEDTTAEEIERIKEKAKEYSFKEQDDKEVQVYLKHRRKYDQKLGQQGGNEIYF